ncbi:MAG: DUF2309 domain-containing protein [Candidatus Algichlamydia australiensis]|nr:DUF2309 domain-containing protein [Chlamydiales bacterium]
MTVVATAKEKNSSCETERKKSFAEIVDHSWRIIAPYWPLKSINAVNPLQGFEHLSIEDAFREGTAHFRQKVLPSAIEAANRETIKWLQAYFDEGQATIKMPSKNKGLFASWKRLVPFDKRIHQNDKKKIDFLNSLSDSPEHALTRSLQLLKIREEEILQFLKLALSTMPGWPSYIKYLAEWSDAKTKEQNSSLKTEYLAMRVVTIYLLWPEARELLEWNKQAIKNTLLLETPFKEMNKIEKSYRHQLIKKLASQKLKSRATPLAQLVFCIDVRSEPFRRAIESAGGYETFGFAGFFGVPVRIKDETTGEAYSSCPVLLSPKHEVVESPCCSSVKQEDHKKGHERFLLIQKIYQSIKYTFSAPFAMVEGLGIASGIWIGLRTLAPSLASRLKKAAKNSIQEKVQMQPSLKEISFEQQCAYAENALRMMGLTDHFAPLVVFCGHGCATENNAYASSLDCGACGGKAGGSNARVLAMMLNSTKVRGHLANSGINIPETTKFIGAEHNTTTDELVLNCDEHSERTEKLKNDLKRAQEINSLFRLKKMKPASRFSAPHRHTLRRSRDWAEVRPEWGLAKNAAFIIGPRSLTQSLDLEGRCFLHSYDYAQDQSGKFLESILTAPMIVTQWINSQYLFSTLDNVSFGGGSKITKNITGKIGIMQGNASDLMTGLPLQSVYSSDKSSYHVPQRLMTVVYAPRERLDSIIESHEVLKKLFGNGWVELVSISPETHEANLLKRDFTWEKV